MNKFVRNLLTEWRKLGLSFSGQTIIAAVSGGADSVSLAIALAELKKRKKLNHRFLIAHFNHDLRGAESEKDAEFVKDLAEKIGFEYFEGVAVGEFLIPKKGNSEQNARIARYKFLLEIAGKNQAVAILTAHTLNDQAETFLMNLIRGSGIAGLSAMKPLIENYELRITNYETEYKYLKSEIALVRPLLNWAKRENTENFCTANQISFRNDAMNEDLTFKRVQIRKKILPVLEELNPKIIETLARTAKFFQSGLADISKNEKESAEKTDEYLILKNLKTLDQSTLYRQMRKWLIANRGSLRGLESKHFGAIELLISSRKSGKTVELPDGEKVVKENGRIFLQKTRVEKSRAAI